MVRICLQWTWCVCLLLVDGVCLSSGEAMCLSPVDVVCAYLQWIWSVSVPSRCDISPMDSLVGAFSLIRQLPLSYAGICAPFPPELPVAEASRTGGSGNRWAALSP